MSGSVLWLFLRFPILFVVDPKMETRWASVAPSQNDPASSRGNQQPAYSVSLFCHGRMGHEEDRECESGPSFFFVDVYFREYLRSIYDFVGCDSLASYRVRSSRSILLWEAILLSVTHRRFASCGAQLDSLCKNPQDLRFVGEQAAG